MSKKNRYYLFIPKNELLNKTPKKWLLVKTVDYYQINYVVQKTLIVKFKLIILLNIFIFDNFDRYKFKKIEHKLTFANCFYRKTVRT